MADISREDLYRKFGPILLEAVCLVIKDQINILRTRAGLAEVTNQQIMDAIETKLNTLTKYDWMNQ